MTTSCDGGDSERPSVEPDTRMSRYSVAIDQTAHYACQVTVPRTQAKDRDAARVAAIASAGHEPLPLPLDDGESQWDLGGWDVDTRFEGDAVVEGPDAFEVTVGIRLWVSRNEHVDAPDGDAACEGALDQATSPQWPGETQGWRLRSVDPLEACDPETDEDDLGDEPEDDPEGDEPTHHP